MNFCCKRPGIAWPFCYCGQRMIRQSVSGLAARSCAFMNWSATGRKTGTHFLLVALALSGRFAAPEPGAGAYHEEKAT
jgi:hypothetical protein